MTDSLPRSPRLRSLELQGYKTFAGRTVFEFAPTITAIVGPNGSGKSNIADAIRWALGEQSYSLLRGKKTEDMIFVGSETRPRASMASATLAFDNSDAWLPIDFAEVVISRRAYRDGENEYHLNGQKVRLRDVTELLSECGLGQRTHTIIGQGLVDVILSLKPEERRRLIEEAAGIGLYRERREESLRRLETTKRNLERVMDILAELRPRLGQMERQAKRAAAYQQIREDLLSSLRLWYGFHWYRQQAAVASAREEADRRAEVSEAMRARLQAADRELTGTRAQIDADRRLWQSLSRQASEARAEREVLARRLAVAEERARWLADQETTLAADALVLEQTRCQLHDRLQRAQAESEQHARAAAEAEEALAQWAGEGEERLEGASLQGLAKSRENLLSEKADLEAQRRILLERLASLGVRETDISRTVQDSAKDLQDAEVEVQRSAESLGARCRSQQTAQAETERLRAELASAEKAYAEQANRLASSRAKVAGLEAGLEARRQARVADGKEARESLERAGEAGILSGWLGRIRRHLLVPAEYQAAVAAALGPFREGLTFHTVDDIDRVLEWLSARETVVEAGLVPIVPWRTPDRLSRPEDPDCLGVAADLVRASPDAQPMIEVLLSRVLVAIDKEAAKRLARSVPIDCKVVTLAGEVFYPSGAVTARRGDEGSVVLVGSEEPARQLQVEKDALGEAELEHSRRAEAVEAARMNLAQAEETLATEREAEREAHVRSEKAKLLQVTALGKHAWLEEQLRAVEAERAEGKARLENLAAGEQELRRSVEQLELELRTASLVGPSHDPAIILARRETALSLARSAAEEARARLEEATERLHSLERDVQTRQDRLQSARNEQQLIHAELVQLRESLSDAESRLAELERQIGPLEETLTLLETRRSNLESEESQARAEVRAAERQSSQAQIELAKREQELGSLQRRIQDDFGLVAFDYDETTPGPLPLPIEGLVEHLRPVSEIPLEVETQVERLRGQLRRIGPVSPEALQEHEEVKQRVAFLTQQVQDLQQAEAQIRVVVADLDELMDREFKRAFEAVSAGFRQSFARLFGGGSARLTVLASEDGVPGGIEIEARLPGRREQGLAMFSGGERSLTAWALIFALLKASPTPFCVLDEVDAMLDDANVVRFCELLQELSLDTQVIVITHNRQTIQSADVIYGVSMGSDSASRVVSLKLAEAEKRLPR